MGNDTRKSRVNNAPNTKTTTKCPKILDKLRLGEKKRRRVTDLIAMQILSRLPENKTLRRGLMLTPGLDNWIMEQSRGNCTRVWVTPRESGLITNMATDISIYSGSGGKNHLIRKPDQSRRPRFCSKLSAPIADSNGKIKYFLI